MTLENKEVLKKLTAKDLNMHLAGGERLKPYELRHLADIYLGEQLLPADLAERLAEMVFAGGNHFYDALSLIRHKLKKPEIPDEAVEEALLDITIRAIQIAASGIEFETTATGKKVRLDREEATKKGVEAVCANFHVDFKSAELLVENGLKYYDNLQKSAGRHNEIKKRSKSTT